MREKRSVVQTSLLSSATNSIVSKSHIYTVQFSCRQPWTFPRTDRNLIKKRGELEYKDVPLAPVSRASTHNNRQSIILLQWCVLCASSFCAVFLLSRKRRRASECNEWSKWELWILKLKLNSGWRSEYNVSPLLVKMFLGGLFFASRWTLALTQQNWLSPPTIVNGSVCVSTLIKALPHQQASHSVKWTQLTTMTKTRRRLAPQIFGHETHQTFFSLTLSLSLATVTALNSLFGSGVCNPNVQNSRDC